MSAEAWKAGRDAAVAYVLRQAEALEADAALPPLQRAVDNGAELAAEYRVLALEIGQLQPPADDD